MTEYKRCPFCGSNAISAVCRYGRYGRFVTVKCDICGASGKSVHVSDDRCSTHPCTEGEFCYSASVAHNAAKKAWNTRADKEEEATL